MKKLILLAFGVLAGYSVLAQGTLQYQNTTVTAFFTNTTSQGGARGKVAPTAGIAYALFYSDITKGGTANNLSFATAVGNSANAGVIAGNSVFAVPGSDPGDTVALMIISYDASLGVNSNGVASHIIGVPGAGPSGPMAGQWDGSGKWFAQSPTIQVVLGPTPGPGSVMFGTSDASHIGTAGGGTDVFPVPEPSLLTLAGLGAAGMMIFRRRR